jgi:hypothetical protein
MSLQVAKEDKRNVKVVSEGKVKSHKQGNNFK